MTSFFRKDMSMKIISDLGIQIPQVYLPQKGTDLAKWAVIACDQFTSQPEYWNNVEKIVGGAPSTLNLTFPEVYLEIPGGSHFLCIEKNRTALYGAITAFLAGE